MNEQKKISFELSIEETNLVLEALGMLPYHRVYALINKMQSQAMPQVNGKEAVGGEQ